MKQSHPHRQLLLLGCSQSVKNGQEENSSRQVSHSLKDKVEKGGYNVTSAVKHPHLHQKPGICEFTFNMALDIFCENINNTQRTPFV